MLRHLLSVLCRIFPSFIPRLWPHLSEADHLQLLTRFRRSNRNCSRN